MLKDKVSFYLNIFFFQKQNSLHYYKILWLWMLYTNHRRDLIVPCMWRLTNSRKGEYNIARWRLIVVIGSLAWLQLHSISLAITSRGAQFDWRRLAYIHESIMLLGWSIPIQFPFMGVGWILSMVENEISCAFITNIIPSS